MYIRTWKPIYFSEARNYVIWTSYNTMAPQAAHQTDPLTFQVVFVFKLKTWHRNFKIIEIYFANIQIWKTRFLTYFEKIFSIGKLIVSYWKVSSKSYEGLIFKSVFFLFPKKDLAFLSSTLPQLKLNHHIETIQLIPFVKYLTEFNVKIYWTTGTHNPKKTFSETKKISSVFFLEIYHNSASGKKQTKSMSFSVSQRHIQNPV